MWAAMTRSFEMIVALIEYYATGTTAGTDDTNNENDDGNGNGNGTGAGIGGGGSSIGIGFASGISNITGFTAFTTNAATKSTLNDRYLFLPCEKTEPQIIFCKQFLRNIINKMYYYLIIN